MKDILTRNWGKERIILDVDAEAKPTEIHLKENGAFADTDKKEDAPSLAIVNVVQTGLGDIRVVSQVSVQMLADALAELGYSLTQKVGYGA